NGFILSYITHKLFKWDLTTSLLACAPAGISQMSSIALDMNADAVIVSIIQTIRLITIIVFLPPIILNIIV
ncbi:MAG: AbrB family transcriptional regulator, partial [Sedimentibacter sp.]